MKKRILFVEDGAIFREPIKAALEQEGYKVETATNGFEALDRLNASLVPFDLMLLDMGLPEMDGLTLLRKLRGRALWKELPVIMLTAVAEKSFVLQACELGVNAYLTKAQFSLDDLLAAIARELS